MMRALSASMAIIVGFLLGLFGVPAVLFGYVDRGSLFFAAAFVGLFASAIFVLRGGNMWFLRGVLAVVLLVILSDAPGGFMEGGIFVFPLLLFLLVALVVSLAARNEKRNVISPL